jgi:hypothetical protein
MCSSWPRVRRVETYRDRLGVCVQPLETGQYLHRGRKATQARQATS